MFDLIRSSLKFAPKFVAVVTVFGLLSACSHQAIAPANNDSGAFATPEPIGMTEARPSAKPAHKAQRHGRGKKIARHAKTRHHKIAKHHVKKSKHVSAAAATVAPPLTPPPAPPAPPTSMASLVGIDQSILDDSANMDWLKNLAIAGVLTLGCIVAVVTMTRKKRVVRKKSKGRKLVYN